MQIDNWFVTEVWYCDQEGWNTWMVTLKNEDGDCLAESEYFYRKGDALRKARYYLNKGLCQYMSVETKNGKHQYTDAGRDHKAKNDFAMKRREAHLMMRAMDACIWSDPQDVQAMQNIALRLWNSGKLAGLPLTETMLDMLPSAQRNQYRQTQAV